ncbi:MAG: tetratricopeptide repeat protein [Kofleriaceae bacterium]
MRNAFVVVVALCWLGCNKDKPREVAPQPGSAKVEQAPKVVVVDAAAIEPPPVKIDAAAALALIKSVANDCKGKACAMLGMELIKTAPDKALPLLKLGCETGDGISCGMLGLAFKEGLGIAKNLAATVALNDKSCELGYFKGCYNLGLMLYNGEGVDADEPAGLKVLEKACNGDAYRACGSLADLYATKDKPKAQQLAKRGCDNHDPMSCEVAEKLK